METDEPTEQVIGSKSLYDGRIVRLRLDTVRLPDGREAKREVVAHKGAVCVVPVLDSGDVLLVRQYRVAVGKFLLEIPAGTLEDGEDPAACAARELEEETGYRAGELRPLFSAHPTPGYATEIIHAYLATNLTPTQTRFDAEENIELVPLPFAELEARILRGEIEDMKTVAAVLAARPRLPRNSV